MGKQKKETLGWGELLILGAVPFVMVLGNSMLIPVFPKFEQVLNINQVKVGLLVTAFSLPAGLLIPFSGILSDRIGRKIVIAPALVLYGLGGTGGRHRQYYTEGTLYCNPGRKSATGIGCRGYLPTGHGINCRPDH